MCLSFCWCQIIGPFSLEAIQSTSFGVAFNAVTFLREIIIKRPHFLVKKDMVKMFMDGFTNAFACSIWFHSLPAVKESYPEKIQILNECVICIDCMAEQVPTKFLMTAAMSKFNQVRM